MRDRGCAARVARVAALVACLAPLGAARAGEARAEPPPLVPPRAIDAGDVPYPAGATAAAVVVLELVIDPDGRVASARVVDGAEPFAGAALAASARFRFTPARRGDVAVSARVRMRVAFTPATSPPRAAREDGATSGSADGRSPAAPSSSRARAEPPADVTVRGARPSSGESALGAADVRQMPGAFDNPLRAIEALPGATPIASGLPFFFVRGAPPGNTGYFLDGVRVPLLFHVGVPSVIHPALVDHVDFWPGGFPARYGRFAGGVVAAETTAPSARFHGEAELRAFDAGALVEGPFADRGTALVAGRYSYTAPLLSLTAPDTRLAYWDYQARATWDLGARDRLTVFAFGSYDDLAHRDPQEATPHDVLATEFHRVDLRWDHALSSTGRVRLAATLGVDHTEDDRSAVGDRLAAIRLELEEQLAPGARLRAGADAAYDHYDSLREKIGPEELVPQLLYPERDDVQLGAWADVVWRASSRVEIVPGLRADLFDSRRLDHPPIAVRSGFDPGHTGLTRSLTASSLPAIDPRVSTRVTLAPRVAWITTFGVSHQPPSYFVPVPGLQIGELKPSLQTSLQASQGIEVALPAEITATVTAFLHHYLGMTDLTETCGDGFPPPVDDTCVDDRVRGRSFGAELLVRRPLTKRLTGWLSYTLSRSTREAHVVGTRGEALTTIPGEYDRTHVLNAAAAYDLGGGVRAGARFVFYTGRPYSQETLAGPVPPYNELRLPPFWRVDLRVEKRWRVGARGSIALVAEGLNVTLNKEAIDVTCTNEGRFLLRCVPDEIGPVTIPSLGLEAFF